MVCRGARGVVDDIAANHGVGRGIDKDAPGIVDERVFFDDVVVVIRLREDAETHPAMEPSALVFTIGHVPVPERVEDQVPAHNVVIAVYVDGAAVVQHVRLGARF